MTDVEDLIIAIKSEGMDEVEEDLESVDQQMEESTDQIEESAGEMEAFSEEFAGAMNVVVGGLAVAAGGLLSQVPIIGQVAEGLFAVIEALAFQIDQVLRPALQPVSDFLFDISAKIFELDGGIGDLVGLFSTLAAGFLIVLPVAAKLLTVVGSFGSTFSAAIGIIKGIGVAISNFASFLAAGSAGALAAAAAIGALIGTIVVGILQVTGISKKIREFGSMVGSFLPDMIQSGMLAIIGIFAGALAVVGAAINGFIKGFLEGGLSEGVDQAVKDVQKVLEIFETAFEESFGKIIDDALGWGKDLITEFIKGIKQKLPDLDGAIQQAQDKIKDGISHDIRENDRQKREWGRDMMAEFGAGIEQGMQRDMIKPDIMADGDDSRGASTREIVRVAVDGRNIAETTKRFSDREISRRGRFS